MLLDCAYSINVGPLDAYEGLRAALLSSEPPFLLKVAEINGKVVAFSISGAPRYQSKGNTVELWALNVEPAHWRKGIGHLLVREALTDVKSRGIKKVELWCISGNKAACNLYEICGFTRTGEERTTSTLAGHPLHEVAYENAL
jgi:ribosomal protein S18 acetylase RimI-like enzyme